jgi:hypothetical protein
MGTAKSGTQGEGDYEATRRYRKRTEAFLAKNDVSKLGLDAAPRTTAEAQELEAAEVTGRARAKTGPISTGARGSRR